MDKDLDFDIKTQIGRNLKDEWLRCKSASDEASHLQNMMEMLHDATFTPLAEDVPWHESANGDPPTSSLFLIRLECNIASAIARSY